MQKLTSFDYFFAFLQQQIKEYNRAAVKFYDFEVPTTLSDRTLFPKYIT